MYWEADTDFLDAKRADYKKQIFKGNLWFCNAQHVRKGADEPQTYFARHIGARHLIERGANWFPAWLRDGGGDSGRYPNLTRAARHYLERAGLSVEDLFHHTIATLHDPAYLRDNAGALRVEWPRIPLPGWPDSDAKTAADTLAQSAAQGRELACLLDPEALVPGVTQTPLRPDLSAIAVPSTVDGRNMAGDDFALTAGWGHLGAGGAVMPGQGRVVERAPTPEERAANPAIGETTFDVYLNDRAFWRNVPADVWNYKLGGYQVLKKWLSYRERTVLGRALPPEGVHIFAEFARRITDISFLFQDDSTRNTNGEALG